MHAKTLVEITARLVLQADVPSPVALPPELDQAKNYWSAAKCRLQSWDRTLSQFTQWATNPHNSWAAHRSLVEEILLSDLVTRLWSATLAHADMKTTTWEVTGLANGIFVAQVQATNRALQLLVDQPGEHDGELQRINRFRNRLERWTDLLLGTLHQTRVAARYACERTRMLEFAADHAEMSHDSRRKANRVLWASLSADLHRQCGRYPANPDLNRQIAAGMLEFFKPQGFDSLGLPKGSFQQQLEHDHQDLQALCDQLIALDSTPVSEAANRQGFLPPNFSRG